jgi:hypothetical protein
MNGVFSPVRKALIVTNIVADRVVSVVPVMPAVPMAIAVRPISWEAAHGNNQIQLRKPACVAIDA